MHGAITISSSRSAPRITLGGVAWSQTSGAILGSVTHEDRAWRKDLRAAVRPGRSIRRRAMASFAIRVSSSRLRDEHDSRSGDQRANPEANAGIPAPQVLIGEPTRCKDNPPPAPKGPGGGGWRRSRLESGCEVDGPQRCRWSMQPARVASAVRTSVTIVATCARSGRPGRFALDARCRRWSSLSRRLLPPGWRSARTGMGRSKLSASSKPIIASAG